MYNFGKKSLKVLGTVNKYLVMTAKATIKESKIDISIPKSGGLRTTDEQYALYQEGASRADGIVKLSKHQRKDDEGKGMALDLIAYVKGQSWNRERAVYIITLFLKNFERLKDDGFIPEDIYLHCGIFWKPDLDDGKSMGWDTFHTELRNTEQTTIFV